MARNPAFASLPKFRRGPFWLFLVTLIATLLLADRAEISSKLLLNGEFSGSLYLWQPLTSLFLFPDGQLGGLFLTLIVQWFLAGHLEAAWGTRRYVGFVVACAFAGTLATALLGLAVPAVSALAIGGSTGMDLAALIGFAVVFARQPLQLFGALPIKGFTIGILAAFLALAGPLLRGEPWPYLIPTGITLLVAYLAAAQPWRATGKSGKVGPRAGRRGARDARHKPRKNRKTGRKGHLRVVRDDDDGPMLN
ncbi:MAG: rhomboid family intramembrane serine protease [Myxococcales bacterium]|nr:rhomboid family intramembrane serine protease [Myxococcales bacterium]